MNATRWRADLTFLVKRIEETHPYPYGRISKTNFRQSAANLRAAIPRLTDAQIVTRMMALVASLQDGHTTLKPLDPNGFNAWYPLRFYWFADGLFITAAGPGEKALIGAQVLTIGGWAAEEAARLVSQLQGADNVFGARERIQYLSNAAALFALGISPSPASLILQVKLRDASVQTVTLAACQTVFEHDRWMYWGEMYGPPGLPIVASLRYLESSEFRKGHPFLPIHLRCREPFFFEYLSETRSIYMQFNFVQNAEDETFVDFHQRLFAWIDRHAVDKFILDIRYNSGGNGGLLLPFVHQFIKRDSINQPGHFYVLVGRKTFSAGVNLIGHLTAHTHAFFVGEPAGAALNSYGDAETHLLPNSKLALQISRLYHQMSTSDDKSRFVAIQLPALFSSAQYFGEEDPALEAVLKSSPISIPDLLWLQGREAAMQAYREQVQAYGDIDWWTPFTETMMNDMGYRLLAAQRVEDALAAFQINTARFPNSWNAWDSLAEAYWKTGSQLQAKEYYAKSYSLNPGNINALNILNQSTGSGW